MLRTSVLALGVSLMATTSFAMDTKISEVDVTADMTAIENAAAAAYWTHVADDIENAITARIVDDIAEKGAKISVDINELSLANSFQNALGIEDAVLVGQVNVTSLTDNSVFNSYELTVSAETARAFAPDGVVLSGAFTDTPEYYAALVAAFADGVVERIE